MRNEASVYKDGVRLQTSLAPKIVRSDEFEKAEIFCACDVAYQGDIAFSSAVVMNKQLDLVEVCNRKVTSIHPYVPGLFFMREAPVILSIIPKIKSHWDILLVDGHGILHPRRCGLASYLGLVLDRPAIGVAKSLLCGSVRQDNFIEHSGEVLGYALGTEKKRAFVSPGHKVGLETAVQVISMLIRPGRYLPEPLLVADRLSKEKKKSGLRP